MRPTLCLLLLSSFAHADVPGYPGCHYMWRTFAYTTSSTSWCAHEHDDNTQCNEDNFDIAYAYAPNNPPTKKTLLLFLPGTGTSIDDYQRFMQEAAFNGYYVIGLPYPNNHPSDDMCGYHGDCYGKLYEQLVDGDEHHFYTGIRSKGINPSTNSVSYRLHKFLQYMKNGGYCSGFDWMQFWDSANDSPRWSKIVVAGHSHGGELTTWITKNKAPIAGITFEAPYANLDSDSTWGGPTYGSDLTPFSPGCHNCNHDDVSADYLTPGDWQNRLYVTLADTDKGYDLISPVWRGHNMRKAAQSIGKTELYMDQWIYPSSGLGGRHWWTVVDNPQPSGLDSSCSGHTGTIMDKCIDIPGAQDWLVDYWGVVLRSALP